jgi:hypothetical protein
LRPFRELTAPFDGTVLSPLPENSIKNLLKTKETLLTEAINRLPSGHQACHEPAASQRGKPVAAAVTAQ